MTVNSNKFPVIQLDKHKPDFTDENINIGKQDIQVVSDVKMLRAHIDRKLNFILRIHKTCQSVFNQLNALTRLKDI